MSVETEIDSLFSSDGKLATYFKNFKPRQAQVELAQAVANTVRAQGTLIAEAGTGTGKTYAYLVPSLLYGGKVLISTGTKTLQDQLYKKDLPAIRQALGLSVSLALLKGRANYVCHYHLARVEQEGLFSYRKQIGELKHIIKFAQTSFSGDKAELASVPEEAEIWSKVTSNRENCLGSDCEYYKDCFVMKARKEALDADVVVINHALFFADLALKGEGITELLPSADTVVFDEAHQLPSAATKFLANSLSSYQLQEYARDVRQAGVTHAKGSLDWIAYIEATEKCIADFRLSCIGLESISGQRCSIWQHPDLSGFETALSDVQKSFKLILLAIREVAAHHPDLEALRLRGDVLIQALESWLKVVHAYVKNAELVLDVESKQSVGEDETAEQLAQENDSDAYLAAYKETQWVRWIELSAHNVRLNEAPLSIAPFFSKHRPNSQAWVLTSATLSVKGNFDHFVRALGLSHARQESWESPFDYAQQALLYVPQSMPASHEFGYSEAFVQTLLPVLERSQGHALILCTSHKAVDYVARRLAEELTQKALTWPVLKHGDLSRSLLIEQFRSQRNAILVGSASFWEGVDLAGDVLTLVAIDKLPFAPPDDPVMEARIKHCKERGGNPFFEFQLPEAALALKQGAGRLIRTEEDWGVLLVADTRLVDKAYGKLLWRGLPPFKRTRVQDEALAFFDEHEVV